MSFRVENPNSMVSCVAFTVGEGLLDGRVWLREAYSYYYYYFSFSGPLLHATRRRA